MIQEWSHYIESVDGIVYEPWAPKEVTLPDGREVSYDTELFFLSDGRVATRGELEQEGWEITRSEFEISRDYRKRLGIETVAGGDAQEKLRELNSAIELLGPKSLHIRGRLARRRVSTL